jgi:hypothetical protein
MTTSKQDGPIDIGGIDVDSIALPDHIRGEITSLIPDRYWIVGYDAGADAIAVIDPDGGRADYARNDRNGNAALRSAARAIADSAEQVWLDATVNGIDGKPWSPTMLMNVAEHEFREHTATSPMPSLACVKYRDSERGIWQDTVAIHMKPGFLENLAVAASDYADYLGYVHPRWLADGGSVNAYEAIDAHPLGWWVDDDDRHSIITHGNFSRLMGWQSFLGDGRLSVEPLHDVRDPRLEVTSADMDDLIVSVARAIDRCYEPTGADRTTTPIMIPR